MDNVNTRKWSKSNFSKRARYQNVTIHVQSCAKHVHENHEKRPPNPQSPVRVQTGGAHSERCRFKLGQSVR